MTSRVLASVDRVEQLEADLETAMAALESDKQRGFVRAFTACGVAAEAVRMAGYSIADVRKQVRRLKGDPNVKAAIKIATELRERTSTLDKIEAAQFIEQMMQVRIEDLLIFDENTGTVPIGVRDWSTLTTAQQQRVKRLEAHTRRSAKGYAAHVVKIIVELVPWQELFDRLAKLRDWNVDHRVSVDVTAVRTIPVGGRAESAEAREAAQSYMDRLEASLD